MLKVLTAVILAVLAVALAEPRVQQHRGLAASERGSHPYLFLTVPRGRGGGSVVQGFEVLEEDIDDKPNAVNAVDDDDDTDDAENDDDDDDDNDNEPIVGFVQNGNSRAALSDEDIEDEAQDDDDDNDDEMDANLVQVVGQPKPNAPTQTNLQMILQNAKPTQMMVSKEHAGAIMVPDGIIEIEGQRIIDENTGKAALLVPREALDAIPDGSVVALMERSAGDLSAEEEEERANRVIVRRRRRGSRRNVRRRGGQRVRRRRVNNNNNRNRNGNRNKKRRRVNRRNVRVVRKGNNNRRRRNGNRRRRNGNRPVVIQG